MRNSIYDRKAWLDTFIRDAPADRYDAQRIRQTAEMIPGDVRSLLDVGVGGGCIYRELRREATSRRCFGIDISEQLVKQLNDAHVCVADTTHIPFRDRSFDLVLAADILEHIKQEDFARAVSELVRVSARYILISSPYKDAIDWPVSLCNVCDKEFNVYGHERSIDLRSIKRLFRDEDFEILKAEFFGPRRDARPFALVCLAREFGKVYSAEAVVCPNCFNGDIRQPRRNAAEVLFGRAIIGILFLMDRLTPALFKQKGSVRVLLRKKR